MNSDRAQTSCRQGASRICWKHWGRHLQEMDFPARSLNFAVTEPARLFCYCKQVSGKANPAVLLHQTSPPCSAKNFAILRSGAAMLARPFLLRAWHLTGIAPFSRICWETACSFCFSSVSFFSGAFLPLHAAEPGSALIPARTCPSPFLTVHPSDQEQLSAVPLWIFSKVISWRFLLLFLKLFSLLFNSLKK